MSRYIKLEDAIDLFSRSGEYHADAIVDMLFFLPTIEVSEDAVDRRDLLIELEEYHNNSDMPVCWHDGVADAIEIVRSFSSSIPREGAEE